MFRTIFLAISLLFLSANFANAMGSYQYKTIQKDMIFEWSIVDQQIDIRLTAPTTGWLGIGFNPSQGMKDANFVLGYIKKGKVKITDDYGKTAVSHTKDTKNDGTMDVTNVSGHEHDGISILMFTIPLNSGDSKDRIIDSNENTVILLAYGAGRDSFRSKHKRDARFIAQLSTGTIISLKE